jgi:hypothetical protein
MARSGSPRVNAAIKASRSVSIPTTRPCSSTTGNDPMSCVHTSCAASSSVSTAPHVIAVFEKFAGIFGPAMFWLANMAFGSSRPAILAVTAFFVGGGVLLARVDIEPGQRAARAAEQAA